MKLRGIVFLLEWVLANTLVWKVLNETYSFYTLPWILWNITFGIFLFKLFTAPGDDGSVWPIGPTVGAFGFVLTAIKKVHEDEHENDSNDVSWNMVLGYCICLFGFALIGISSDFLGDEWRDAPPPTSGEDGNNDEQSELLGSSASSHNRKGNDDNNDNNLTNIQNLVTSGPYMIIRHPIYCGLLLEAFGSNVVGGFASWISFLAFCSVTAAYVVQLQQEEHELNNLTDGQYDYEYKQRTRFRLVPFIF